MSLSSIPNTNLSEISNVLNSSLCEEWFYVESKMQASKLDCVPIGDAEFHGKYGSQPCHVPELVEKASTECDRAGSQPWLWSTSLLHLGTWCAFNPSAFPFNLCEIKPRILLSSLPRSVLHPWAAALPQELRHSWAGLDPRAGECV